MGDIFKTEMVYAEFNPRDFKTVNEVIDRVKANVFKKYGENLNEFEIKVGRLHNNAELHFLKSTVTVKNDIMELNPDTIKMENKL